MSVVVIGLLAGLAVPASAENASELQGGQQSRLYQKEIIRVVRYPYLLYLPEGYGKEGKEWPTIVFLHGMGERGDDIEKIKEHGPPRFLADRTDFPFIVVSPQCPDDRWWKTDDLVAFLDDVLSSLSVDEDRVYLTGLSMGGFATWELAAEHPERFAAIAPICGGGEPSTAWRLRNMPIWAFHGAKDASVPVERSRQMVEAVRNHGGHPKLTIYPEAGHDSWTETYDNPELYEWFLEHKREAGEKD